MDFRYTWDFGFVASHYPLLLRGLVNTAWLAVVALCGSLFIGLLVGLARTSHAPLIRLLGTSYVELFRNIPALIHLYIFFYLIPVITGWQSDAAISSAVAISLYTGAFMAEVYRSGIESIDRGQGEAAKALGFGYVKQMRHIILPQALRRMIPVFTNRAIELVKLTGLASLLAYREIVYVARQMASVEFRPLESFTVLAILFTVILLPLSYLSKRLELYVGKSG